MTNSYSDKTSAMFNETQRTNSYPPSHASLMLTSQHSQSFDQLLTTISNNGGQSYTPQSRTSMHTARLGTSTPIQNGTETTGSRTMSTQTQRLSDSQSPTTSIVFHTNTVSGSHTTSTVSGSHTTSAVSGSHTTSAVSGSHTMSTVFHSSTSTVSDSIHTTISSRSSTTSMSDSHTSSSHVITPTPSSGGIPQKYLLILYIVPPLGGVVCCLLSLALCLALKRYRK